MRAILLSVLGATRAFASIICDLKHDARTNSTDSLVPSNKTLAEAATTCIDNICSTKGSGNIITKRCGPVVLTITQLSAQPAGDDDCVGQLRSIVIQCITTKGVLGGTSQTHYGQYNISLADADDPAAIKELYVRSDEDDSPDDEEIWLEEDWAKKRIFEYEKRALEAKSRFEDGANANLTIGARDSVQARKISKAKTMPKSKPKVPSKSQKKAKPKACSLPKPKKEPPGTKPVKGQTEAKPKGGKITRHHRKDYILRAKRHALLPRSPTDPNGKGKQPVYYARPAPGTISYASYGQPAGQSSQPVQPGQPLWSQPIRPQPGQQSQPGQQQQQQPGQQQQTQPGQQQQTQPGQQQQTQPQGCSTEEYLKVKSLLPDRVTWWSFERKGLSPEALQGSGLDTKLLWVLTYMRLYGKFDVVQVKQAYLQIVGNERGGIRPANVERETGSPYLLSNGGFFNDLDTNRQAIGDAVVNNNGRLIYQHSDPIPDTYIPDYRQILGNDGSYVFSGPRLPLDKQIEFKQTSKWTYWRESLFRGLVPTRNAKKKGSLAHAKEFNERIGYVTLDNHDKFIFTYTAPNRGYGLDVAQFRNLIDIWKHFYVPAGSNVLQSINLDGGGSIHVSWNDGRGGDPERIALGGAGDGTPTRAGRRVANLFKIFANPLQEGSAANPPTTG